MIFLTILSGSISSETMCGWYGVAWEFPDHEEITFDSDIDHGLYAINQKGRISVFLSTSWISTYSLFTPNMNTGWKYLQS